MKQGGHSKKKTIEIRPSVYYITLIALGISNLSVFMLGVLFSQMLGVSMGSIAEQGYKAQAAKAALYFRDDGPGGASIRGGRGGGLSQPMLNVSLLSSQKSALTAAGVTRTVGEFTVQAQNDDIQISGFEFTDAAPDAGIIGDKDLIASLEIRAIGSTDVIATGSFPPTSYYVTLVPSSPITVPVGQTVTYQVRARFATPVPGDRWYQRSGQGVAMLLYGIQARPVKYVNRGLVVNGLGQPFPSFSVFSSVPTVIQSQTELVKTSATSTVETLSKAVVTSLAVGPVGIAEMSFVTDNPSMFYPTNLNLYESDSSATLGNRIAQTGDIVVSGNVIRARFDVNDDDFRGHSAPGVTDSFIINAGVSKYFTLQALTTTSTGTIMTKLIQDTQVSGTWPMNVLEIERYAPSSNFIWSDLNFDLYSSSTATSSSGWFNGFRVPGL